MRVHILYKDKKMKAKILFMMMSLAALNAGAQKVDNRLTGLVKNMAPGLVAKSGTGIEKAKQQELAKKAYSVELNADGSVKALGAIAYLKQGVECPTAELEANGITVKSVLDNMVFLTVPAEKLSALEGMDEILFVEADVKAQTMSMDARKASKADIAGDETLAKAEQLPQAYTGKDVVIGVIDTGIDFNHAAFKDANNTSRVKKAVTYIGEVTNPDIKEYSGADIASLTSDSKELSHGTHTSSIAGGSLVKDGSWQWQGVAPEADLVLAGMAGNNSLDNIVDAMDRIVKYADEVQKPLVLSISMGRMDRLHDGSDPMAKKIKEITEEGKKQGRVVVLAPGNAADNDVSVEATLGAADNEGWQMKTIMGLTALKDGLFTPNNTYAVGGMLMYASDGKDFTAELRVVNIQTGEVISGKENVENCMKIPGFEDFSQIFTLTKSTRVNVKGETIPVWEAEALNSNCYMNDDNLRLAIFVKGTTGQTINIVRNDTESKERGFFVPDALKDKGYTKGGPAKAFSAGTCEESAISVGSYITHQDYTNCMDQEMKFSGDNSKVTGKPQVMGEISDYSSFGQGENGVKVPTVIAPGHDLLAGYNLYDGSHFKDGELNDSPISNYNIVKKVTSNGRNSWWAYEGGTSMACPHVAGIVALWLQADPTLTANKVKEIMKETSVKDDFVTDATKIPSGNSIQSGMGKIDALAGLKKIKGVTAIEAVSSDSERMATPATMYDVDAPVYNMMGQRVSKWTPGLVIYKGRKYVNR